MLTPIISALERPRQEDGHEFKARLDYKVRPCQKGGEGKEGREGRKGRRELGREKREGGGREDSFRCLRWQTPAIQLSGN